MKKNLDELQKLLLLYGKAPAKNKEAFKKMFRSLGLQLEDEETSEFFDTNDLLIKFHNEDLKQEKMKKQTRKEVTETERKEIEMPMHDMVKFESKGDTFKGWLKGATEIDFGKTGKKRCYVVVDSDEKDKEYILPTNVNITKKVAVIEATKGFGCPIEIIYTGETEKTANGNMQIFKVYDSWEDTTGANDLPF